jgi:type II secretory pathway component GspD/PulD (secretin)
MNRTLNLLAAGLLTLTLSGRAIAQNQPSEAQPSQPRPTEAPPTPSAARAAELYEANRTLKTYYLSSITQQNDANEILITLRNMLSVHAKMYLVSFQNAIAVSATPEDQAAAQRIINDLDRPHKVYRLTFTLAESDSGKRVGIQHFSIVVAAGQRTVLKQGDKIPVATGTYGADTNTQQTQFQYLDVGLNFDATLTDSPDGLLLKSKVEESSLGQPSTIAGVQEPVIRQTSLEGTSAMKPGKPLTLGSLDIENTTRHIDIEVVAEPIS